MLGQIQEIHGHHADALHQCRLALDLFRAAGHRRGQGLVLNNIGWCHLQLGEYQQAITACQEALALAEELGDRYGQAGISDSLGYAYHHLDRHTEAIGCYLRALQLCRDLDDRYNEAEVLTHLGDTQQATGDTDAARAAWHRALSILDQLGHSGAQRLRDKLGQLDQESPGEPEHADPDRVEAKLH